MHSVSAELSNYKLAQSDHQYLQAYYTAVSLSLCLQEVTKYLWCLINPYSGCNPEDLQNTP